MGLWAEGSRTQRYEHDEPSPCDNPAPRQNVSRPAHREGSSEGDEARNSLQEAHVIVRASDRVQKRHLP